MKKPQFANKSTNNITPASPRKWIIHPGHLGGDSWHIVGAMMLEESIHLIIATEDNVFNLWEKNSSNVETFLPAAFDELQKAQAECDSYKGAGKDTQKRKVIGKKRLRRKVAHYKELIGLIELLHACNIDPKRWRIIPFKWDEIDNPYKPAVKSAMNNKPGIMEGDIVGLTMASTSVIARELHNDCKGTIMRLRNEMAPVPADSSSTVEEKVEKAYAEAGESKVLIVIMRCADENKQHNTTRTIIRQIATAVREYNNREDYSSKLKVLPFRDCLKCVAKNYKKADFEELDVTQDDYKDVFLTPFAQFDELVEIDDAAHKCTRRPTRGLICEFWRQIANHPKTFGVLGGRSGSLDIACMMGVKHALCFDVLEGATADKDNIRLFLMWRIMSIALLNTNHVFDKDDLQTFLSEERSSVKQIRDLSSLERGFFPCRKVTSPDELTGVADFRKMKETNTPRGCALLLFQDGEFPKPEEFFPD